eukprot:TRINITY_DN53_c0_g1_i1.p1 TRINITY_DN53_c0_g1~~TRINITY_DN53_c0_g1_i1.p1  ORF type:complete len:310 (+),score=135.72 TRINITY_DN53_c0_g1_i1:141-1070(+)
MSELVEQSEQEWKTAKIDGRKIASEIRLELQEEIKNMEVKPHLSVVLVGERGDSATYVRMKQKAAEEIGMDFTLVQKPTTITEEELLQVVDGLNNNDAVHGIIVQLPLPDHINSQRIVSSVSIDKDVDGFLADNMGGLALKGQKPTFIPCTAQGIYELLKRYEVEIEGKDAVVVGRSNIVGIPISLILMHENATVTICHSRTKNLEEKVSRAEILIAAAGNPELIKAEWIKPGAVVIDVGTNPVPDETRKRGYRLVGDVEYKKAFSLNRPRLISPSVGGVGPMTVVMLLKNTTKAAKMMSNSSNNNNNN